jgi:oligosaccharide repeat unit polymerase
MEEYATVVIQTFEKVSDQDLVTVFENGLTAIAERFESVSSLAVVVSNYEKLGSYEQSYGLDNNIWKDSITFLIPRILWTDKPVATDPGNYGDLYFNFRENSFTITPMGDLLRNFGPVGVPVGMFILGLFIRAIYSALRENQEFSFWRATLFYMLLTSISYEGSYGLIIPYLVKICIVSVAGILIVRFFVGKTSV